MKVICITLLLLLAINAYSQKISYSRMDSMAYDLTYTKNCIGKFKKQIITGYVISSIGVVGYIAANSFITYPNSFDYKITTGLESDKEYKRFKTDLDNYYSQQKLAAVICGGVFLVGCIFTLDSYSWLKKASLRPSKYGVTLSIDLDSPEEEEPKGNGYGE